MDAAAPGARGVGGAGRAGVRDAVPNPPVRRLTVLHDPGCPLCRHLGDWLRRQPQLVPLEFVAVGSDEAKRRFPDVDQTAAFREITVIGDGGQVWTGRHAFVTCLWALGEYRALAHRLSTPAGLPLARGAALAAAKYRAATRPRVQAPNTWNGWGGDTWNDGNWPLPIDPPGCDGQCAVPD